MCPDDYGPRYFGAAAFFWCIFEEDVGDRKEAPDVWKWKKIWGSEAEPQIFFHFQTDIDLMLKNRKGFNIYIVIDRCKQENKSRFDNENIFHYNHWEFDVIYKMV